VHARKAFGHSYQTEHFKGAVSRYAFTGRSLTWWTLTGPTQGKAAVIIDGHRAGTVNNYAAKVHAKVGRTYRHLGGGSHAALIKVLGRKGSTRGRGTSVAVDAFSVGKHRTNTPKLTSSWGGFKKGVRADLRGAQVTMTFRGTGFTWVSKVGRTMGIAKVYLDGKAKGAVDNYATATKSVKHTLTGLTDALHTIQIVVAGRHHKHGKGNQIVISKYKVA
jgi:hypothetical protein